MDAVRGLIGEKLSHSFSKLVHERLCGYSYDLIELSPDRLDSFMKNCEFTAINVTIPYKEKVIPYIDYFDQAAKDIGAVNTVVNRDGKLFGYNTDFNGFIYNLKMNTISLTDKIVLILGNGGTCKTASAAAKFLKAKEIIIASRKESQSTISYSDALKRKDVQVIINTTPIGMYPNNDKSPIELDGFCALEGVVDAIYNPINTKLILTAKKMGIKYASGLRMLVAQALYSAEYFLSQPLDEDKIEKIVSDIKLSKSNLVLIGMPGCGKSSVATLCADMLGREAIDTDSLIEERTGMSIAEIFERQGEDYFRNIESQITAELSLKTGLVIATGGGIIKNEQNVSSLKQNGVIVFIDRPANELAVGNGRPLSSSLQAVLKLYESRYPLYTKACDETVLNGNDIENTAMSVVKAFECKAKQI